MPNPEQGITKNNRLGTKIKIRSLKIAGTIRFNEEAYQVSQAVRLMLIAWYDNDPVVPENILQTTVVEGGVYSPYNREALASKQFIPIFDKVYTIGRKGGMRDLVKFRINAYGKRLPYKSRSYYGDGSVNSRGQYWLLTVSDRMTIEPYTVSYYSRMTFTDV